MTAQEHPSPHPRAGLVTWGLVLALVTLPVVWLDVYLLATDDASAEYLVGRYSLLLGAAAAVMLVIERLRPFDREQFGLDSRSRETIILEPGRLTSCESF